MFISFFELKNTNTCRQEKWLQWRSGTQADLVTFGTTIDSLPLNKPARTQVIPADELILSFYSHQDQMMIILLITFWNHIFMKKKIYI